MSPRAYGEYYKGIAPWIFGAFAESESDRFLYNYLNYYIFSKVAWDNRADFEALLEEHYRLMFGNAAPAMKKFYETLEDKWVGQVAGRVVDTPLGRLDSSHRENLIERYFPDASHQVILLSTDEEIYGDYYEKLKPFISRSYTVVYDDKTRSSKANPGYQFSAKSEVK